jgi:hypothetical protein
MACAARRRLEISTKLPISAAVTPRNHTATQNTPT